MAQAPNHFVIGAGARLLLIEWDGSSATARRIKLLTEVEQEMNKTRFNDGKIDPQGRIWAGTMLSEEHGDVFAVRYGGFYRFANGVTTQIRNLVNISNGLTWNERTNKFYYIDTGDNNIKEFDFDPNNGNIFNEVILMEFNLKEFGLDGMTIDQDGLLYIACFNGSKVIKVDPVARKILQEIQIPDVPQITSVAFGGPNLDELFVTSGNLDNKGGMNGGLFKVTGLGAKGTEMHKAVV